MTQPELPRPGKWSAWATLALSLLLTALTFVVNRSAQEQEARVEFDTRVASIERRLERRLRGYEQTLRGAAGLIAATGTLDREQWKRYVTALDLENTFPGVLGIGFAQWVPGPDLTAHERAVRREGFPNYAVWPRGEREGYSAIVLLEPFDAVNMRAFGYDMFAEPMRRAAMAHARDTGGPALSGKVTLVQEGDGLASQRQSGFLLYLPVYERGAPTATQEQRREALSGWVYAPFRARDFLAATFRDDTADISVRLYDGDTTSPDALLHSYPTATSDESFTDARHARVIKKIPVYGRDWTLEVRAERAFQARTARTPLLLVGGVLVSFLLFTIVWVLATARERAVALAEKMTQALRGMNDTLEAKVAERTTDLERANARLQDQIVARESAQRDRATALERLQKQVEQLGQLAAAALLVNRTPALPDKLAVVAAQACALLDARRGYVQIRLEDGTELAADAGEDEPAAREAWRAEAPRRYAGLERASGPAGDFIALPLVRRSGAELGFIALAEKRSGTDGAGSFGSDDEVILSQLALLATASIKAGIALDEEQRARAEAEAASRAKDDFIAVVSHELRTPLNAIQGWLHILRRRGNEDRTRDRALEVMQRNLNAQVQLVEDLLDTARLTSHQLHLASEPVDFAELLVRTVESWRPAADEKGIEVAVDVRDPDAQVTGDARRLEQVIWNLLSNAVKFTPSGGHIDVVLERAGNRLRLAVTDTGAGIPAEFLPHVFDRFRQADASSRRRFGGLGLGLALVKGLVEAHGGTVGVESAGLGQGAAFLVDLPVRAVRGGEPSESQPAREPVSARLAGLCILVVDDHPDALDLLETILTDEGARVATAATGAQALERLHAGDMRCDAVLCDIGLPDEDGYQVVGRIRELEKTRGRDRARLPVIALTAFTRKNERDRALAAGFDEQLSKPVDAEELVSLVATLAARR